MGEERVGSDFGPRSTDNLFAMGTIMRGKEGGGFRNKGEIFRYIPHRQIQLFITLIGSRSTTENYTVSDITRGTIVRSNRLNVAFDVHKMDGN